MSNVKPLTFVVLDSGSGHFSRDWEGEEKVDRLRDQLAMGAISSEAALMAARRIAREEPDNLDAQQFLAVRYWESGMKDESAETWAPLYERVAALIPDDYKGTISWYESDNRPFLRLAHGHLLGLMRRRDSAAASKLCKQIMAWDPNDGLGVRYLQPLISVMAGRHKSAYKQFLQTADDMPNGWYHASRMAFLDGRFTTALTLLRKGILANPYIAEAITGRRELFPHLYWHSSSRRGHGMAKAFVEEEFDGWRQEAIDFVDWGFNCSLVMRERAAAAEINEGLTHERDVQARMQLMDRSRRIEWDITDESSAPMICKVTNHYGQDYWPWDRVGAMHPAQRDLSAEQAIRYPAARI